MNLGNFSFIDELDAIRRSIGAPLTPFNSNENWKPIDKEVDVGKLVTGRVGEFIFEDNKIVVYIRDYHLYFGRPKFHLTNCQTLISFQNSGTYHKYFATNRTDGNFKLNLIDNFGKRITSKTEKLEVCKHCLTKINYKNYRFVNDDARAKIYKSFNLTEYLENTGIIGPVEPTNKNNTRINTYPEDWEIISKQLKEQKNWTCEQCKKRYIFDKYKLHVHHKNELKWDNSPANLEVLCVDCHQTRHRHRIAM